MKKKRWKMFLNTCKGKNYTWLMKWFPIKSFRIRKIKWKTLFSSKIIMTGLILENFFPTSGEFPQKMIRNRYSSIFRKWLWEVIQCFLITWVNAPWKFQVKTLLQVKNVYFLVEYLFKAWKFKDLKFLGCTKGISEKIIEFVYIH